MWRQPCTHRAFRRLLPNTSRGLIASGVVTVEAVGTTARRSLSRISSLRQGSRFWKDSHNDVSRWNVTLGHAFSTSVKETEDEQQVIESEPDDTKELSIEDVTSPGQAQQVLCRQKTISTEDFQKLIATARTGNAQDAVVLLYCLKHMKVYKGLVISADTADMAVEKILDCLVGDDDVTPQAKVDAATLILSNFQEDTGLYYALRNYTINKVLRTFWDGVQGGGVATAATEELTEDQHPWVVLLHQLIRKLNYRRSRPHLEMKKRAARLYKRHIRQHSGTNQGTIQLATQIALHVASAETVQKKVIFPCQKRKCRISDETLQLVGLSTSAAESALAAEGAAAEEVTELEEEEAEVASDEPVEALAAEDLPADETVVTEEESSDEPATEVPQSSEEIDNKTAS